MSARQMRRANQRRIEREHKRSIQLTRRLALGSGTALGATVLFAPAADAATFTVTNLDNDGPGSLRQAAIDANQLDGDDDVVFQAGLTGTITLSGANSAIELYGDGIDIQGPGADQITVDGNDLDRIFFATDFDTPNEPLRIAGLTLRDGNASAPGGLGGALYTDNDPPDVTIADSVLTSNSAYYGGGAIWNDAGSLTILNTTLTDNEALNENGGALYAQDTGAGPEPEIVIRDSTFSGNTAGDDGGAINVENADGDIVIENTVISGNEAGDNGGGARLYNDNSDITIRNSAFADNEAGGVDGTGGGLALYGAEAGEIKETIIEGSTFSGNRSSGRGGGAALFGTLGPVTVTNTTVSGNTADADNNGSGYGGGLVFYNYKDAETPRALRNSTIVGNSAAAAGGVFHHGFDDPDYAGDDLLEVSSTIVANNTAPTGPDLGQDTPDSDPFSLGFSLIENTTGATITESPAGSNLLGLDPLLGPLADNGGGTQTRLPLGNSPALDAGIANGLATDQRGQPRTFDASNVANKTDGTDIGATELSAVGACKGKAATVLFAPGQKITGSAGKDVIVGTDQKDKVSAKGGKDTVCAGKGNDSVKGGGGKDKLFGEKGKDKLKGGGGKDKLSGGPGKDKLRGGPGKDKLSGGGGKDSEVQ